MTGGYHNAPHGPRRQAVPRLSRGTLGTQAAHDLTASPRQRSCSIVTAEASGPPTPAVAARAALGWHRLLRLSAVGRGLEPRRVLLVPGRREGGQQAPFGGRGEAAFRPGRPHAHEADDDVAARDRHATRSRGPRPSAFGLDDARAHGPRPASALLPL